jgi:arsenate reductase-like glutaredoxin family protein
MRLYLELALLFIKKQVLLFTVFICTSFYTVSAQQTIFKPAIENDAQLKLISVSLEKSYQQDIAGLPSENKKELVKIYKQRWDNIQDKFDKKEIYADARAQQYLDATVAEIVKANPLLQHQQIKCYFSKSGIPNAAYLGEGLIVFNMGLFSRLNNESQAAFVLCHELAHLYLNHSENSIQKYVATLNSDEVQKQLRNIKKTEYGKRAELEKLLKGLTFDTRRHGRDHESSADSMGVEFLRNTRFDIAESLTALALLDSIDTDTLKTDVVLQSLFNAKEYPFKKRWIFKEEGLLGGHAQLKQDESLADSLKTHPDCKLRMKILEPTVLKYQSGSSLKNIIDTVKFEELKNIFRYEVIEYDFTSDNYTKSLQHSIELLQANPSDPYLINQIGKIFNGFFDAQKNHTLGKVTELPAPYFESNYNLLLQFVQNLFLEDYASIGYYFLKQYAPQMEDYAPFKSTYNKSNQILKQ